MASASQHPGAAPVLCSALQWEFLADEGRGLGDLRNKSGDLGETPKNSTPEGGHGTMAFACGVGWYHEKFSGNGFKISKMSFFSLFIV